MHILVVGGNGFLGSAVCKSALARSWKVTSISSSGKPYASRKGHSPAWASRVDWHKASAFDPESYANLLPPINAVVHTLGTLFETKRYKDAIRENQSLSRILYEQHVHASNPLTASGQYESINRDSALHVLEAYLTAIDASSNIPRAFIYVSAEDITRPVVPSRYIETKREAEQAIQRRVGSHPTGCVRPVFIRPGVMYHAYARPITSPIAALLSLSSNLHKSAPAFFPTPAKILRVLGSMASQSDGLAPAAESMARLLETPPLHVEHVARAICDTAEDSSIHGVVDSRRMVEHHK